SRGRHGGGPFRTMKAGASSKASLGERTGVTHVTSGTTRLIRNPGGGKRRRPPRFRGRAPKMERAEEAEFCPLAGEDHSSGTVVADGLEQPTRDSGGAGSPSSPIWPCSGWGLPCDLCYQRPGALLPHPFTLACAARAAIGGLLSVALSVVPRDARALPGILPCGARTFLP